MLIPILFVFWVFRRSVGIVLEHSGTETFAGTLYTREQFLCPQLSHALCMVTCLNAGREADYDCKDSRQHDSSLPEHLSLLLACNVTSCFCREAEGSFLSDVLNLITESGPYQACCSRHLFDTSTHNPHRQLSAPYGTRNRQGEQGTHPLARQTGHQRRVRTHRRQFSLGPPTRFGRLTCHQSYRGPSPSCTCRRSTTGSPSVCRP